MRLKWQDSENGATTKKASLTVAGSQIQYRQAGQKDILKIMSSWIIIGVFRYFVTNMRNFLSCILQKYDIKWICESADIWYNRCVEFNKLGFVW